MRILTNEYACNTPNFKKPAKGGPANFARLFFNFLKQGPGQHEWIGVILRDLDQNNKTYFTKKIADSQPGRSIYKISFDYDLSRKILKARKKHNPQILLAKPIDQIYRLILKTSPDIVFLNGFSLGNWILLQAAKKAEKPVIIQHAGIWTAELNIYKDFFSPLGLEIMKEMEKDSSRLVDVEIFLNNFSYQFFQKNVFKKTNNNKKSIRIVPLPVDFNFFKKPKNYQSIFNFNSELFNIGIIARWDRIKNHEAIANLAALATAKKLPWKFHSITSIPDSKKNIAVKKKYRNNIEIIGHVPKEKISDFCQKNDLLIIPSKFDVSPTTLLEALACGTPTAISPQVGFIDDYICYGAKDWVINFDHPELAIKQIQKLRGKKLPKKLQTELFKKHQAKKIFKQYLSLFNELIKK